MVGGSHLVSTIGFSEEEDSLIWKFNSKGSYSVCIKLLTLGVEAVHISVIWSLKIPPRVQCFLWLLSKK